MWWNTLYLDAAVKQIRADGFTDDMSARLSPIAYEFMNFLDRYIFTRAEAATGRLPSHDPAQQADVVPRRINTRTTVCRCCTSRGRSIRPSPITHLTC
ncbi:hypothetical protein [Actinomadura sp. 9N407]|uniref:hypothetical protein n=1 Tax=Actinomadura sp. 9N407 TaxID=3375154 RepID=UPI0037C0AB32